MVPEVKKELRTTTVLFVEFSKGGSLQKRMRDVLDKLTPMLGFRVRVTERGGSTLGALLSNKNLWSGLECGRDECKPCKQPGDKKEPCTSKNSASADGGPRSRVRARGTLRSAPHRH